MAALGRFVTCDAVVRLGGTGALSTTSCTEKRQKVMGDPEETRRLAIRRGWTCNEKGDFCPSHARQGK